MKNTGENQPSNSNASTAKTGKNSSLFNDALNRTAETKSNAINIPQISLPAGGGALKSIDEKFSVNTANGTASFSVPLPFSPNRNGFSPQISLSYNSGTGNSIFGIGWSLGMAAIQRSTDKRLPRYRDANHLEDSAAEDSFMLSGLEELVPVLDKDKNWSVKQFHLAPFTVRLYRPRIEGAFSRIERIHHPEKGYYWKVTSKENITTWFGYSASCRIADPAAPEKTFSWLPEFSYDHKGSWIWYAYKAEDLTGVENTVFEKNRFNGNAGFSNKHIQRIRYGNMAAYYTDPAETAYQPQFPADMACHFEMAFDYGEYDLNVPKIDDQNPWACRRDPYSVYRPGFDSRTYRLCKRILMFHTFSELNAGNPVLVRSLDFDHTPSAKSIAENNVPCEVTYLTALTTTGYIVRPDGTCSSKSLPRMTFDYQWLQWNTEIKNISAENLLHAPVGLSDTYQWTDLYSEGISGILTEQAGTWYYKSNLGADDQGDVQFTPAHAVSPKPAFSGLSSGVLQLQDLEADGKKQLVSFSAGTEGYFELGDDGRWQEFRTFCQTLNIDMKDPNVRMLDLNGDGRPEVVLSDQGAFWWWENLGKAGYDTPELAGKPYDEEKGPAVLFADEEGKVFFADMSGDGMADIVRITNNEVCYWANMGYGHFSAKVTMGNAPHFTSPALFNPVYIHLADISGTGTADILYLSSNNTKAYINLSGNAWSEATLLSPFFPEEKPNRIAVTDLLGNGTACLVWSSPLQGYTRFPMRYMDLMGGKKPHIMRSWETGFGKKTEIEYKSSTRFYLADQQQGTPWVTRLPFPVQCVSKTILTESVTNLRFTTLYTYHHGYYDHAEREFRGFGRVEQLDTEDFGLLAKTAAGNLTAPGQYQAPVLTKTWYHTGAYLAKDRILSQFKQEYWYKEFVRKGFSVIPVEYELPDATLRFENEPAAGAELSAAEWREAFRACKGMVLRQEVFALDALDDSDKEAQQKQATPYSVATHSCEIRVVQGRNSNAYASFIVTENESVSYSYERDAKDPRIQHSLVLQTDELGNVLEAVSIVYPRTETEELLKDQPLDTAAARKAKQEAIKAQQKQWITFTKNSCTNDVTDAHEYLLRGAWQTCTYELTGFAKANIYTIDTFKGGFNSWEEIPYRGTASEGIKQKRLIEHTKTKYYNQGLTAPLPDGQLSAWGISYENYQLAFTPGMLEDIFSANAHAPAVEVTETDMQTAGYMAEDTNWWVRSGVIRYLRAGETIADSKPRFLTPVTYVDALSSSWEVFYDSQSLYVESSSDPLGNIHKTLLFDFRTFTPVRMMDENDNISSVIQDELGMVKAMAVEGKDSNGDKEGEEADNLSGFKEWTDTDESSQQSLFFQLAGVKEICNYAALQNTAREILKNASLAMIYSFSSKPAATVTIAREQHAQQNAGSPLQISIEYSDGLGNIILKKVQAEAGIAKIAVPQADGSVEITETDTGSQLRWVGTGRTVLNNKGKPVKQYEPYFSVSPAYEDEHEFSGNGITPLFYYDAPGRLVSTAGPDGSFSKVVFDAWKQYAYDPNDTVKESRWYAERIGLPDANPDKKAAIQAALHDQTPSCQVTDTLGRPVLGIDHNRTVLANGEIKEEFYYTSCLPDIEGNTQYITDARNNVIIRYDYDMLGHHVSETSMDAGKRWMLNDAWGKPVKVWDERQFEFSFTYDLLHRVLNKNIKGGDGPVPLNHCYERTVYGEGQASDKQQNLRGKIMLQYDKAGKLVSNGYDFKGNVLSTSRIFAADYKNTPDWATADPDSLLESAGTFITACAYDALNRPVKQTAADGSITATYFNPGALLQKVTLQKGAVTTSCVNDIKYNEKGQRIQVLFGNGVKTAYSYDPFTFKLARLQSTRPGGDLLQDLRYTYDPAGNITLKEDRAIPVIFFNNQKITGRNEYSYDSLYRLTAASGRESNKPYLFETADNWNDNGYKQLHASADPMGMRIYNERYQYDQVGNILQLAHLADSTGSWTRDYSYESKSNRLKTTTIGGQTWQYPHHAQHGYMTAMPHLQVLAWNFKEELQASAAQKRTDGGTPETTYYVYDHKGQRLRKITENQADAGSIPVIKEDRLYIGNYELYKNADGLERETLHISDDQDRIAMIDTETEPRTFLGIPAGRTSPVQTTRYQLSDLLGSACLELDELANTISYEEYHPFGSTAYQAQDTNIKAAAKRYRYTGMERDEETGLSYHHARYYLPWLGRWLSADPIGVTAGANFYAYVNNNPVKSVDREGTDDTPAAEKKELSTWGLISAVASVSFTMVTHKTPSQFGMGMVNTVKSLTIDPVMTIYGPEGMLDKAAQKFVDQQINGIQGKEYVTEAEHSKQFDAIVQVGGMLFPGLGAGKMTIPGPPMVLAETRAVVMATAEVAVPNAVTRAPALMASALSSGGGGTATKTSTGTGGSPAKKTASSPAAKAGNKSSSAGNAKKLGGVAKAVDGWFTDLTQGFNMSAKAARYQQQISGKLASMGYYKAGVQFDAFINGILIDAKFYENTGRFNRSYSNLMKGNWSDINYMLPKAEELLGQARAQLKAAGDIPVEWHIAGDEATAAVDQLFKANNIDIKVVHVAPK